MWFVLLKVKKEKKNLCCVTLISPAYLVNHFTNADMSRGLSAFKVISRFVHMSEIENTTHLHTTLHLVVNYIPFSMQLVLHILNSYPVVIFLVLWTSKNEVSHQAVPPFYAEIMLLACRKQHRSWLKLCELQWWFWAETDCGFCFP